MNESKTEKQRYWLTFLLEDLPEGENFQPGILHLTVIPWFVADLLEEEVIKSFRSAFSGIKKFDIKIGGIGNFGPHKEVAVSLIETNQELTDVHSAALKWFDSIEGRWAVKNPYVGAEYKAHIRRHSDTNLGEHDILHLNALTLVKADRQENDIRTVAAKAELS